MKQLIWKEWHELRWLPLASVLCVMVLVPGLLMLNHLNYPNYAPRISDTIPSLAVTIGVFCLIAGAGLIAPEVGNNNIAFLGILPISRRRVWATKVLVSLGMLVLSLLACAMTWAVLTSHMFPAYSLTDVIGLLVRAINENQGLLFIVLTCFSLFAIALCVSTYLDRPLSVFLASILVFACCFYGLAMWLSIYITHHLHSYVSEITANHVLIPARHLYGSTCDVVSIMVLAVFLIVGYVTFTRGETLRSAKRFRVGAISGAVSVGIAMLIFWMGSGLQWW